MDRNSNLNFLPSFRFCRMTWSRNFSQIGQKEIELLLCFTFHFISFYSTLQKRGLRIIQQCIKVSYAWEVLEKKPHLVGTPMDAWWSWKSVGWENLYETYLFVKFKLYKINLTLGSMTLKFNSFRSIIFLWFQSNGEKKLDKCQINLDLWIFIRGSVCEKTVLAKVGHIPIKKLKNGFFFFYDIHIIHTCTQHTHSWVIAAC